MTKLLEIVFIHIKVMSEKGITHTEENLVALREQHSSMCSMSKLIASDLSLVLRREKEV